MTLSSFNYCLMCQSCFFFVCSRTSSCGEIIFLESYENLQTTEYFYFVPAYCTLYIENHIDLKTEKLWVVAHQRGLSLNFCCCWFLLLLWLLQCAVFADFWAHCAYIHILSLYNTNLLFECIRVRRENQCNFGASKDILARFEFDVCP